MTNRTVTEKDFRRPEFVYARPEDYEFRSDGKLVRKDRWETGIRTLAAIIGDSPREFEIDNLVVAVEWLLDQVETRSCPHYQKKSCLYAGKCDYRKGKNGCSKW